MIGFMVQVDPMHVILKWITEQLMQIEAIINTMINLVN